MRKVKITELFSSQTTMLKNWLNPLAGSHNGIGYILNAPGVGWFGQQTYTLNQMTFNVDLNKFPTFKVSLQLYWDNYTSTCMTQFGFGLNEYENINYSSGYAWNDGVEVGITQGSYIYDGAISLPNTALLQLEIRATPYKFAFYVGGVLKKEVARNRVTATRLRIYLHDYISYQRPISTIRLDKMVFEGVRDTIDRKFQLVTPGASGGGF